VTSIDRRRCRRLLLPLPPPPPPPLLVYLIPPVCVKAVYDEHHWWWTLYMVNLRRIMLTVAVTFMDTGWAVICSLAVHLWCKFFTQRAL